VVVVTEAYPKLRPLDIKPYQQDGQQMLLLRDPLGVSEQMLGVPQPLAPLLMLCDGERDLTGIHTALSVRWGVRLKASQLRELVDALDFDNARFAAAQAAALAAYRAAASRPPTIAGGGYPEEPEALAAFLDAFDTSRVTRDFAPGRFGSARGVVSPHIDYARGGGVYRATWTAAAEAARDADTAIIFGTDHYGGPGKLTPTRQSYETPFGTLPTDRELVDEVARALGADASLGEGDAFAEELHHRNEHSIELASVWLHHARGGRPLSVVPILCGSFAHFVAGEADPGQDARFEKAVGILRQALTARRTLVVAAADLAHVGPAFDGRPVRDEGQAALRAADDAMLAQMAAGSAAGFFEGLKAQEDRNNVCGLPPIYLSLRLLGGTQGHAVAYDQCPADEQNTSWVSVAGMVWQ
jgi:AmmeMemoRadiSam system protein B